MNINRNLKKSRNTLAVVGNEKSWNILAIVGNEKSYWQS